MVGGWVDVWVERAQPAVDDEGVSVVLLWLLRVLLWCLLLLLAA